MTLTKAGKHDRCARGADRRAQMPFSVIAVLLLVLSSVSIALLYGLEDQKGSTRIPQERLEGLMEAMSSFIFGYWPVPMTADLFTMAGGNISV